MGGQHERVGLHPVVLGGPAGVGDAAEEGEELARGDAAAQGEEVLAVGGEDPVVLAQGGQRPGLGTLLADGGDPQRQLSLALQGGALLVHAALGGHQPVHALQRVLGQVRQVGREPGVLVQGPVSVQQADCSFRQLGRRSR